MLECLIIGDSIAVGTAMARPECVSHSRGGWNSWQWNKDYLPIVKEKSAKTIVISLGANDHKALKLNKNCEKCASPSKVNACFGLTQVKTANPFHTPQSCKSPKNTAM